MRNFDKELKNLSFRLGSEIAKIAKEKTAPVGKYPTISKRRGGNLKTDIKARNVSAEGVAIGNTLKASYAKFVHFGTKAHTIKPKNKKALAKQIGKNSYIMYGKKVNHPGTKANPYLLNAFKIYQTGGGLDRALKDFAQDVGQKIIQEIKIEFK